MSTDSKLTKIFTNASRNLVNNTLPEWGIGTTPSKTNQSKYTLKKLKDSLKDSANPAELMKAYQLQKEIASSAGKISFASAKVGIGQSRDFKSGRVSGPSVTDPKKFKRANRERMKEFLISQAYTARSKKT